MKIFIKNKLIFIFLILILSLSSSKKEPFFVINEKDLVTSISNSIEKELPDFIDILYYGFKVLNDTEEVEKRINANLYNNFIELLKKKKVKYNISFAQDIDFKSLQIDTSFIDTQELAEMCAIGKLLKKDSVVYGNITVLKNVTKKVWDSEKKKFVDKRVALMQGNFFSTESNIPILRFSYYFLLNE